MRTNPISGRGWLGLALALAVVSLSALHWVVPFHTIQIHNFLQHLFFLPLMVASLSFGWRGALALSLFVGVTQTPHVLKVWSAEPVYAMDQVLELPVFCLAGVVAGLLVEKEQRQKANLEMTKRQLEEVYGELQRNVDRLKRAERLSAAGQLSAGLAHEIRNPLASISGAAGILKRGHASRENVSECLEIIEKESQRLNRLLGSFLEFARPRPPRLQRIDPLAVVDSVIALAQHGSEPAEIRKETVGAVPEIEADPEQLKQVLLNLVLNAVQASGAGAVIRLDVESRPGYVVLSVVDEGPGIPAADLERVFEPFFSTKPNGTGLGLAVAAKIVEQHGGTLSAEPRRPRGMSFHVELPLGKVNAC